MMRYVLEVEWTGYLRLQIVHREVIGAKRALRLEKLHVIRYTDGTALLIYVRPAKYRERVQAIRGYNELIRTAERSGQAIYQIAPRPDLAVGS
jgi:hypothetical protein